MLIKSVHIQNYRSIRNETLTLDDLTILVGANGTGKSTFLRAIDLFYSSSPSITADDFFARSLSNEIVISLTYCKLSDKALERFAKYLQDGELTVDMVATWNGERANISYHGSRLQNRDFASIYEAAKTSKREANTAYGELRQKEGYQSLPTARSYDDVQSALQQWEEANQDKCTRMRDDGQFFGFKEVGRGYLFAHSQFLLISAVRDATQDAEEGKGSIITRLMDLVVRSALANRDELNEFKKKSQEEYETILRPTNLTELTDLRDQLSSTLRTFVPNAGIDLDWQPLEQLNIPMPKASVGLVEDGYRTRVEMTGHGLQRAFIFTMLQHLALAQTPANNSDDDEEEQESPALIIAIEEPELYQHPNRQRHFGRVLRKLAHGELSGVVSDIQIVCATHSPLFIDIAHFNEVRLIRKETTGDDSLPKTSRVYLARYADVERKMQHIKNNPNYSALELKSLMPQLMTTFINEGFFADVIVIVEGITDRAVLLEVADIHSHDLEGMGIGIVSTGGKGNIVIPAVIFEKLGIPTYIVWDCDNKADNDDLFRFVGYAPTNKGDKAQRPSADVIEPQFATFHNTREHTMKSELTESTLNRLLNQCQTELGSKELKKPVVVKRLARLVYEGGNTLPSVEKIIGHIVNLRNSLFE
ncbi:ATP-dependent endonuclease [bacterium]|nr:ATP-dependent endonuclease [bacterium]